MMYIHMYTNREVYRYVYSIYIYTYMCVCICIYVYIDTMAPIPAVQSSCAPSRKLLWAARVGLGNLGEQKSSPELGMLRNTGASNRTNQKGHFRL